MEISFFLMGIILGFLLVAPFLMSASIGSIGILSASRTLKFGRFSALFSSFGVCVIAAICAVIVGLFFMLITYIVDRALFASEFCVPGPLAYRTAYGIIFLIFGQYLFSDKLSPETKELSRIPISSDFSSSFFLAIKNPTTILVCVAMFFGFYAIRGSCEIAGYLDIIIFAFGVFWGALAWCLFFSETSFLFRKKVNKNNRVWVNRIAGATIFGFAIIILLNLIIK